MACRYPASDTADGPSGAASLVQLDSITLEESDTLLIGRVGQGLDVDNEGNLYVAAPSFGKIIRYTPAGSPSMTYGRYGAGPGEFRHVFPVVSVGDSIVLGSASFGRRVNVFRRSDGTPLATLGYAGFVTALVERGDTLYVGNFSRRDSAGVGAVPVESLFVKDPGSTRLLLQPARAAIPEEYYRYSELEMSSDVRVAVREKEMLAAYAPFDWILAFRGDEVTPDTIRIPTRLRKGVARDALDKHFIKDRYRFDRAVESISLLEGIWILPSGLVALIHMDTKVTMRRGTVVNTVAKPYLTLLSENLQSACVDTPIRVDPQSRPVVAVEGDRLYVLEQIVKDTPELSASTVVRTLRIDDSSCEWVPIGGSSVSW
jgi:hypothetical protein